MSEQLPEFLPRAAQSRFKAIVHAEAEGGYWAEIPELPGCFTQGDTLDEIYRNLPEAIACHLDLDPAEVRIGLLEMAA
ncbi:MAG TPA: type II toxin-antitoxin system HicB family antitoxin [Thermoanaerobaculia bacterium]|nr:type II toxin-antitoxin system HicB family antitoxin [Thermoanaerobaculia bacterium]